MLTDPERARGDVHIVARASDYLMQLDEQYIHFAERLRNLVQDFDEEGINILLEGALKHQD